MEVGYLESRFAKNERSKREIKCKIRQTNVAFNNKIPLFVTNNTSFLIRKRLLKTFFRVMPCTSVKL